MLCAFPYIVAVERFDKLIKKRHQKITFRSDWKSAQQSAEQESLKDNYQDEMLNFLSPDIRRCDLPWFLSMFHDLLLAVVKD